MTITNTSEILHCCLCSVAFCSIVTGATSMMWAVGASMGPVVASRLADVISHWIVSREVGTIFVLLVVVSLIAVARCHEGL